MRKEGLAAIVIGLLLLAVSINIDNIFNAFAIFWLAGGIPGTTFSFSDNLALALSICALVALVTWPFRARLAQRLAKMTSENKEATSSSQSKRRRYRHGAI